jgi:hypothetical protein
MVVGALFVGLHAVNSMAESPHKSSSNHRFDVEYVVRRYQTDLLFISIVSTIAGIYGAAAPNGIEHRYTFN